MIKNYNEQLRCKICKSRFTDSRDSDDMKSIREFGVCIHCEKCHSITDIKNSQNN